MTTPATRTPFHNRIRRLLETGTRSSFLIRLVVALTLTLMLVELAQGVVLERIIERGFIAERKAEVEADAFVIRKVAMGETGLPGERRAAAATAEEPLDEAEEVVGTIGTRPHVEVATLIAADGAIAATTDGRLVGTRAAPIGEHLGPDPRGYAGPERPHLYAERERHGGHEGHFEYAVPVELPTGRHVLSVKMTRSGLDQRLSALRGQTFLVALLGVPLGVLLFQLLGGRSLGRSHRSALDHALRDPLTGLANRRAFEEEIRRAIAVAHRRAEALSVAIIDVDDLKLLNDRRGHRHGDEVLASIGAALEAMRGTDRAFRIGGDEFAVLLYDTGADGARAALERVRLRAGRGTAPATLSIGIAQAFVHDASEPDTIREQADAAMYAAKQLGGNAVMAFGATGDGAGRPSASDEPVAADGARPDR